MPAARADGLPRQGIRVPPRRPRAHPGRRADRGRALPDGRRPRGRLGERPGPQPRGPKRASVRASRRHLARSPRRPRLHVRPRGGSLREIRHPRGLRQVLPRDPGVRVVPRVPPRELAGGWPIRRMPTVRRRRRGRLGRSQGWRRRRLRLRTRLVPHPAQPHLPRHRREAIRPAVPGRVRRHEGLRRV